MFKRAENKIFMYERSGRKNVCKHNQKDKKRRRTSHCRAIAPENIADTVDITITFSNTSNPRLGDVIVEISDDVSILTPIVGVFVQGETMNLSSSCTMKVE